MSNPVETITLPDLADKLAERLNTSKTATRDALRAFFAEDIADAVMAGGKVNIHKFGTFSLQEKSARQGRNPRTGEPIQIAASKNLVFKAVPSMKVEVVVKKTAKGK